MTTPTVSSFSQFEAVHPSWRLTMKMNAVADAHAVCRCYSSDVDHHVSRLKF
jgi:hypothetical protein